MSVSKVLCPWTVLSTTRIRTSASLSCCEKESVFLLLCLCHLPQHWDNIPDICNLKKVYFSTRFRSVSPCLQGETQKPRGRKVWAEESCSVHVGQEAEKESRAGEGGLPFQVTPLVTCSPDLDLPPKSKSAKVPHGLILFQKPASECMTFRRYSRSKGVTPSIKLLSTLSCGINEKRALALAVPLVDPFCPSLPNFLQE